MNSAGGRNLQVQDVISEVITEIKLLLRKLFILHNELKEKIFVQKQQKGGLFF